MGKPTQDFIKKAIARGLVPGATVQHPVNEKYGNEPWVLSGTDGWRMLLGGCYDHCTPKCNYAWLLYDGKWATVVAPALAAFDNVIRTGDTVERINKDHPHDHKMRVGGTGIVEYADDDGMMVSVNGQMHEVRNLKKVAASSVKPATMELKPGDATLCSSDEQLEHVIRTLKSLGFGGSLLSSEYDPDTTDTWKRYKHVLCENRKNRNAIGGSSSEGCSRNYMPVDEFLRRAGAKTDDTIRVGDTVELIRDESNGTGTLYRAGQQLVVQSISDLIVRSAIGSFALRNVRKATDAGRSPSTKHHHHEQVQGTPDSGSRSIAGRAVERSDAGRSCTVGSRHRGNPTQSAIGESAAQEGPRRTPVLGRSRH